MATTPASNEASEIRRRGRRRLIGAVAIVLLAVVFIPMIFDSEPRPPRNEPALDIPSKDNAPPLPAPGRSAPGKAAPEKAAPAPAPSAPAAKAAPEPAPVASVTPKAAPPTPRLEGFAVQVGAFREEEKLQHAREKLAAAGIAHYTERLEGGSGTLTRLRAGPFKTRAEAEAALGKIQGASLDGKVVPLP